MAFAPFRRLSITARLILGVTFITALLWCLAAGYATYVARRELNEIFDQTLKETAGRLLPLAIEQSDGDSDDPDRPFDVKAMRDFMAGRKQYLSYQLADVTGRILLRSEDAPQAPFAAMPAPGFSTVGNYRLYSTRDDASGMTFTVAETNEDRWEAVSASAYAMALPLLLLIPVSIAGIWFAVATAMRPVARLARDIAMRGGSNLTPLDISDQPAELKPIADQVGQLVDRLRSALDAERAFAATSAHELRTPIAGALAQTQRLIAALPDAEDRGRAREIEQTLKRLAGLAEKLMQLARLEAGIGRSEQPQDLVPALDLVVSDACKRLDRPERLVYAPSAEIRLTAPMDLDAFAMAARNLIDNAIRHGAADGIVEVIVEPDNVLRVVNGGPVVDATVLHGLKRRFVRGQTRAPGSGLGLAIVDQVMTLSGGSLELISPAAGRAGGFEAHLTLPR